MQKTLNNVKIHKVIVGHYYSGKWILNGSRKVQPLIIVTFLVTSVLLNACAVGPDFHPLPPPATQHYTRLPLPKKTVSISAPGNAGKAQYFVWKQQISQTWWELFRSQQLNALVAAGLRHNQTLAQAKATLQESQEMLQAAIGSLLLPSIDLQGAAQRNRVASVQYGVPIPPNVFSLYTLGGKLTYVLDVFGKQRRQVEIYRARVDYERYELLAAYLTLTSNITMTFINIASIEAQIAQTRELITAEKNILRIVTQQFAVGGASEKEVLSQKTTLAQTEAQLPPLQKAWSESQHAMAVLIGKPTSQAGPFYYHLDALHLPATLPIRLPSDLVQQRPDIQAAQALLHEIST